MLKFKISVDFKTGISASEHQCLREAMDKIGLKAPEERDVTSGFRGSYEGIACDSVKSEVFAKVQNACLDCGIAVPFTVVVT